MIQDNDYKSWLTEDLKQFHKDFALSVQTNFENDR